MASAVGVVKGPAEPQQQLGSGALDDERVAVSGVGKLLHPAVGLGVQLEIVCAGAVGLAPNLLFKNGEAQSPADTEFLPELHSAISTLRTRWRSTALAWCRASPDPPHAPRPQLFSDYLANAAAAFAVVGHEALVRT
jgi:hypothetical protein